VLGLAETTIVKGKIAAIAVVPTAPAFKAAGVNELVAEIPVITKV
jgi:hypothetical protein